MYDRTYLQERITKTKAMIEAYEDAVLALGTDGIQSYDLDTGQTRQRVTKLDLDDLNETLEKLYNRLAVFEARLNGCGTTIMRPCW